MLVVLFNNNNKVFDKYSSTPYFFKKENIIKKLHIVINVGQGLSDNDDKMMADNIIQDYKA